MRGTPTLYYGDELGLTDVTIPPALVQDPRESREPGLGLGRDPVRSPMPWDGSTRCRISTVATWLPLNADWPVRNVGCQTEDASSILTLHRRLLTARRTHSTLSAGGFRLLDAVGNVLAYERWDDPERLIVGLNLGASASTSDAARVGERISAAAVHGRQFGFDRIWRRFAPRGRRGNLTAG